MANKLISEMGLPRSIANIFAARNITTAKDALSLTEFELMELLDVGLQEVRSALKHISQIVSPPYQTALLLMEQHVQKEQSQGHLPTQLKGLDAALCGGIPFGVLTELVGPSGIGKTQFCLKLSLLASLPAHYGGLGGHVIYIDVESKFSSRRLIEIGAKSYPEIFHTKGMAQEMAGRILVLRPTSLSEFTESVQQIKVSLLQNQVKLLVIDSMAALVSGEHEPGPLRQHPLGWHISFIKSLAEFSRIPIVVTNQVRSQSHDESRQYSFQGQGKGKIVEDPPKHDSHLVAALGIHWAHAVTIRLVLEAKSGQRFMKVAKSPISPPLAFPFNITSSGISLLDDDGTELMGPDINSIHCQGHDDIINSDGGGLH
ncbi:DNA repair protein RAD51 homolog 2 isoform X1 [Mangifera indica]|uniref:DNA repair protein RAD51 homolog 2 isoform X1 n=2 Tax=Mangifera indica TaxID=29780 RepID=UPI001CFA2C25|nr:DNA repair protein RAD51 homolog 2 isoform X1 [Mangifera indica]